MRRLLKGAVRGGEVRLVVRPDPAVIEIGNDAAAVVVEGEHDAVVVVAVGVEADQLVVGGEAGQPVDAAVIVLAAAVVVAIAIPIAARMVVGAARRIGERAEVVVERMVLLHHDDDVIDLSQIAVGGGGAQPGRAQQGQDQRAGGERCLRDRHC